MEREAVSAPQPPQGYSIRVASRLTGVSSDTLRMWERRYGFPKPGRDDNGERQYTLADLGKLRAAKRLMDVGLRPGKIMALSLEELNAMADARTPPRRDALAPALERDVLTMLKSHDATSLQHTLANMLMRQGLQKFVLETITPLNQAVGDAWMQGELQVFEEHLYTEQLQVALRTAINAFPRQTGTPRVLLTTFPSEQHGLGLLMVEAMMVPEGVQCISLGPQTPLEDIRRAAQPLRDGRDRAHVVGNVFALEPVAARRRLREQAALIAQSAGEPVDFGFGRHAEFRILGQP